MGTGICKAKAMMMAKRKVSRLAQTEQPMNWWRAFLSGCISAMIMTLVLDIFSAIGVMPFSFERYLGTLMIFTSYSHHHWLLGFFLNALIGGVFGFFYAYCFEYVFRESSARLGVFLGLGHAVLAAVAFFPFFGVIHEFMGTGVYPDFGFFGAGLGVAAPVFLLGGHVLFGATMGIFYGPVRYERLRTRYFEPGDMGERGEPGVVTDEQDPEDRVAV